MNSACRVEAPIKFNYIMMKGIFGEQGGELRIERLSLLRCDSLDCGIQHGTHLISGVIAAVRWRTRLLTP